MPKKFGINQKAAVANERKEAKKNADRLEKQQKEDEMLWADNDKHVQKKQQRKEAKEAKDRENEARKAEKKALREAEEQSLAKHATKTKTTHFMIQRELERTQKQQQKPVEQYHSPLLAHDIKEKNRSILQAEAYEASGLEKVTSAVEKLDVGGSKPQAVTYKDFEARKLPSVRQRLPGLRLSQYKQMVWSEWKRSVENPANSV